MPPPEVPTSWPQATAPPTSWPQTPPAEPPTSWPQSSPPEVPPTSWPQTAAPQGQSASWPQTAAPQGSATSWPEIAAPQGPATSWPETAAPQGPATSWPQTATPHGGPWPETRREESQGPPPAPAWGNLSSPAPWPPADQAPRPIDPLTDPLPGQLERPLSYGQAYAGPAPVADPERTVTYQEQAPAAAQAPPAHAPSHAPTHSAPNQPPSHQAPPRQAPPAQLPPGQPGPGQLPPGQGPDGPRPGSNLSRDPSDPDRPFVTAGQTSGSRTPPPERQQELWNTVFGDNYQAMNDRDDDDLDGDGKPVWVFALGGSVAVALIVALLWAFLGGPLAADDGAAAAPEGTPPATATPPAPKAQIKRLPKFPGEASPVNGVITDVSAGITVPKLGGPWTQDLRATMRATYGFTTRQYMPAGTDALGRTVFAQVLTGPLSPKFAAAYSSPENLEPVIKAVVVAGRKKFFPTGNTIRKTAQQSLKVGDAPAYLIAYEVTAGEAKTRVVAAAIATGADLPSIVYMSVPSDQTEVMPDINSVFKQIRLTTPG